MNMKPIARFVGVSSLLLWGCGSPEGSTSSPRGTQPESGAAVPSEDHSAPLVTVAVGPDQTVEFYDFKTFALMAERGPAGNAPSVLSAVSKAVNPSFAAGHLVDQFRALRPDLPVPQELIDLDVRIANAPPPPPGQLPPPNLSGGGAEPISGSRPRRGGGTVRMQQRVLRLQLAVHRPGLRPWNLVVVQL
jgi:hypothetical protein